MLVLDNFFGKAKNMGKQKTFAELSAGDEGVIAGFSLATPAYRKKLLAMGMTPGTPFKVVRKAPLGDPMEIQIRGYLVSLRKREAAVIEISEETELKTNGTAS